MKTRHLTLFLIASLILIASEMSGGSLLGLFVWLQIATLLIHGELTKSSQLWALKLFLISIPFVICWGSTHSFLFIYLKEKSFVFLLLATILNLVLSLIASFYFILTFEVAKEAQFKLGVSLSEALTRIKIKKRDFFLNSGMIFAFSLVPFLSADWKILFALMATHLYLYRSRLKQAFASGF